MQLRKIYSIQISVFLVIFVLFGIENKTTEVYAASGYPSHFFETRLTNSLSRPTVIAAAPDGRLFVSEKAGKLRVIKDGVLLSEPFLTLSVSTNSERGLLGIAFDPNFTTNRYIYVYYTKTSSPVKNRISRFTASESNPDIVEAGSEFVLHDSIPSDSGIHQAGAIHFGLDGKLYIAVGDNGTPSNAQDLSRLTGKILRINSDGTIPEDNPFVGQSGKKAEIWAYGFRNPFTFAVDKSTGKIFINDVGSKDKEEINNLSKGANYGWPTCEGTCSFTGMTNPEYEYTHEVGQAIIGGAFYRGLQFPSSYDGDYFFADYVQGWIKVLDVSTDLVTNFATFGGNIVGMVGGVDGALYFLTIGNTDGSVYKITYDDTPLPPPPPGEFPPVVRSSSSGSSKSALSLAKPTGTVDGDLLILTASADLSVGEDVTFTIPSGWTDLLPLTRSDKASAGHSLQVWYKIADSEPANYTIIPDHGNLIGGSIVRIDGQSTSSPLGVSGVTVSTTGEAEAPAVITDGTNSLIFRFVAWDKSKTLISIPSDHTQTYHVDVSGHDSWGGYEEKALAGNTGAAELELSSESPYVGFTIAIRPLQSGSSTPPPPPPPGSGSTPVVRSSSSGSSKSALSLAKPTGTVDGDLLILTASADLSVGEDVTFTIPSGWTDLLPLTRSDKASAGHSLQVWYKIADSEPANYTIIPDHGNLIGGSIVRIDGQDSSSPIGVSGLTVSTTGEASAPAVTTDVANSLIFRFVAWDKSKTLISIPSDHTQTYHVDVSGHDSWGGYEEQTAAGNTGIAQFDLSSGSPYVAFAVAINSSQISSSTPIATIILPVLNSTFSAGDTIQYSGSGSDLEDGTLPASALEWTIDLHHNTHTHPFLGPINDVQSGSFLIPNIGETSVNIWYRIKLEVTDSDNNTYVAQRDIFPEKTTITLSTVPAGLNVTIDGQPKMAPYVEENVVGMIRQIGVISPQIVSGRTLQFISWSDGGAENHNISILSADVTYTAIFEDVTPPSAGVSIFPTDDAFVDLGNTKNYGNKTYVSIDANPLRYGYLKFDLSGLSGSSSTSTLRLFVTDQTSKAIQKLWFTISTDWNQSTLTSSNRPQLDKSVPSIGEIDSGDLSGWVNIDLTDAVNQKIGGLFSIGIDSISPDGIKFFSIESLTNKPFLIIQ